MEARGNMIGRIIGNYEITSELAQGGMGTVYRARHLHLPREVVVKSIHLTAYTLPAQQNLKARFRREAYIQSQLDHPNIVRVYEFFALDDNYYLVMEYVPGRSLKDLIAHPGLPSTAQVVNLCKQALAALNYAHNYSYVDESNTRNTGIIHRDIKPANLLLDHEGKLKITDFGIVKVTGDEALTASGFQPGTVEYMSPEQLLGLDLDERSDLYSLGVTFYEMLTGRLPFPRSATGSDWEVRKGHVEMEPPSILEIRPDIHPALAAVMMRALRKHPNDRYQSAAEFLEALHEYEQYLKPGGHYQPFATGQLQRSAFAHPTIIDHTVIIPEDPVPLESETYFSSPFQYEESITIPIAPVRDSSGRVAPRTSPRMPASNPSNREVFISIPAASPRRWPLPAAMAGLLLLGTIATAYFLSSRRDGSTTLSSASTKIEIPITSPTPVTTVQSNIKPQVTLPSPDSISLTQARAFEQLEHYPEAIRKYEDHLRSHPGAAEAEAVSDKLVTLRRFQDLMTAAKVAMESGRFGVARQNYKKALSLRPDSDLAKSGLTESESRIKSGRFGRVKQRSSADPGRLRALPPKVRRK
jgi:serine/threonine protein kinase